MVGASEYKMIKIKRGEEYVVVNRGRRGRQGDDKRIDGRDRATSVWENENSEEEVTGQTSESARGGKGGRAKAGV